MFLTALAHLSHGSSSSSTLTTFALAAFDSSPNSLFAIHSCIASFTSGLASSSSNSSIDNWILSLICLTAVAIP